MEVIAEGDYSNELYIIVNGELQVGSPMTLPPACACVPCAEAANSSALLILPDRAQPCGDRLSRLGLASSSAEIPWQHTSEALNFPLTLSGLCGMFAGNVGRRSIGEGESGVKLTVTGE